MSENLPETTPFSGHDHGFASLEPAINFFKRIVAKAAEESPAVLTH